MTTIDTISFNTSIDYLKDVDYSKFKTSTMYNPKNGLEITKHYLLNKKTGLNGVSINETSNAIIINASSKLLGADYKRGVSLNTIEQFTDEINKMGLVLDKDYINDCNLFKVDIKDDLRLTKDVQAYINAMNHLNAPKFFKTPYETGIAFKERISTNPIRFVGYNKGLEILRTENKDFLAQYPSLINQFKDNARFESRLPKVGTIKKYFGSNSLVDVLNHKGLNYEIFKKIIHNQTNFKATYNTSEMTNTEEKNFAQIYLLNDKYNGDFNSILNHIKRKLGSKTKATYQRNQIKKYLAIINNSKDNETLENIKEITGALKK